MPRLSSLVTVVLAALVIGSGCTGKGPAAPTAGGGLYSTSMVCTEHGEGAGQLTVVKVERCLLQGPRLSIQLDADGAAAGDQVQINISPFKGVGSYTTLVNWEGAVEEKSTWVRMHAAGYFAAASGGVSDCPAANPCTIEVTNADVSSAAVGAKGRFAATITCPTLGGAGVKCVTCTIDTPMKLDLPTCDNAGADSE